MSLRVETTHGPVIGTKRTSILDNEYIGFFQIPYAKPPIGDLRFKDPVPIEAWQEPIHETTSGAKCWGFGSRSKCIKGDEDCLKINIYTKNLKSEKPYPVMVYIHGGAFMQGSSSVNKYGPDYIFMKEVMLVTINYRIGALGFLTVSDPKFDIPGNAGLKDQCLALKWIKANIDKFGGDQNNITLIGHSAGSCSAHYHSISPMSEGLFHKAILMSGTVFSTWATVPTRKFEEKLARAIGWNGNGGIDNMIKILQNAEPLDIVQAQNTAVMLQARKEYIAYPFGPVIEPYQGNQCFVPKDPKKMAKTAWGNKIPFLIGGVSEEGLVYYPYIKNYPHEINNGDRMVPTDLRLALDDINPEEIEICGEKIKKHFYGTSEPTMDAYIKLMGERAFWHGIYRTILSRLNAPNSEKTFLYRFSFDSKTFNFHRIFSCGPDIRGTAHADDLCYLFYKDFIKELDKGSLEFKTIERMVGIITKFSIDGDPNDVILEDVKWEPITTTEAPLKCLHINDKLSFVNLPENANFAFWDSLYPEGMLE